MELDSGNSEFERSIGPLTIDQCMQIISIINYIHGILLLSMGLLLSGILFFDVPLITGNGRNITNLVTILFISILSVEIAFIFRKLGNKMSQMYEEDLITDSMNNYQVSVNLVALTLSLIVSTLFFIHRLGLQIPFISNIFDILADNIGAPLMIIVATTLFLSSIFSIYTIIHPSFAIIFNRDKTSFILTIIALFMNLVLIYIVAAVIGVILVIIVSIIVYFIIVIVILLALSLRFESVGSILGLILDIIPFRKIWSLMWD